MHRRILVLVACATVVVTAHAQKPITPPESKPPVAPTATRETKRVMIVQGCVFDKRLKLAPIGINAPAALLADEFVLDGPKELMRQLKANHDGHEEQISGIVTIPPLDDRDTLTSTKRVGPKTTITAQASQTTKPDEKKPDSNKINRILRLRVEEVRHVENKCPYPF